MRLKLGYTMMFPILILQLLLAVTVHSQSGRRLGKFTEVYAWKQISYNIDGNILTQDRVSADGLSGDRLKRHRERRQSDMDNIYFPDMSDQPIMNPMPHYNDKGYQSGMNTPNNNNFNGNANDRQTISSTTLKPSNEPNNFFIQYNNVPMGTEKVGGRLFITLPRRRYGIPSTLNYLDLSQDTQRSPPIRPYPSLQGSQSLVSVYRTRADHCNRLWMVDTGLLEIPDDQQQLQPPAIVVFDLRTDRQLFRYELKTSDLPANNTPTGLASITLDTSKSCDDIYAYIPDLVTYGVIVYSLREGDSWRLTHNYMHFNPLASSLRSGGQRFQWNDGIFSLTLSPPSDARCRTAYFHPLISTQEFSVSTCILNNRTAASDADYWTRYNILGDRGENSQSTMHDMHSSGVIFYADINRDSISCWDSAKAMNSRNVPVLATHAKRLSYPADIHVTGDEVWVIANSLPQFGYASLDTDEYNFFIYKGIVDEVIAGTECAGTSSSMPMGSPYGSYNG